MLYVLSLCAPSVLAPGFPQEWPAGVCFGADIKGFDLIFGSKTSNDFDQLDFKLLICTNNFVSFSYL